MHGRAKLTWRRLAGVASLIGLVAAVTLALGATASGSSDNNNHLVAHVVLTQHGPLPACSGSDCTTANLVWEVIYVANDNPFSNESGTRATRPNSFVVSSIDETILIDGAVRSQGTLTPPPNMTDRFASAGRWPSTVTCGQPPVVPCSVVTEPAILPGENTAMFYEGWVHSRDEPNGLYVFRFTVHGTLNGEPVDLTASSPPIVMTN
jgi:hypothetical protein